MFITLFSSIRESLRRGGAVSRLTLALFGLMAVAQAKPVAFDIPAQPAADALIAFSKQAKADVLYSFKDLSVARSHAVVGEYEPAAAIALLLKDTGFVATLDEGKFVVVREKLKPGSIGGSLVLANSSAPATGVVVTLRETGATAVTGRTGGYFFNEVPAGAYTLLAAAEGFSRLKITDVVVKAGTETTLSVQSMPVIKRDGVTQVMEEFVVSAKGTELMDKFEVSDLRAKPFSGANMDITRTINDVQPYTIFDAKSIEQSGATNVEDFLKQRLTMNTVALTNGQTATTTSGNTSTINLRGVGTDKTLILVNGRRIAGVSILTNSNQPDLNGIPLNSIERIEVLPSSASGIYGGSAIGGVVNVILKRDYAGGEIRAGYDNTWDTDAPRRTLSASYGMTLEGGKTHVMLSGSWSDSTSLLLQDRVAIYRANFNRIQQTLPTFVYSSGAIYLGAAPNIQATGAANLILRDGTPINSRIAFVPVGTAPSVSSATLATALLANAGRWNLDLPPTTQASTGLLRPFGNSPTNKSFQASVRRQMLPKLEVFADFSYNRNQTDSIFNGLNNAVDVSAPTGLNPNSVNPFTTRVQVRVPDASQIPITTVSENRSATFGTMAQLPFGWTGELDYTWSENRFNYRQVSLDAGFGTDVNNGVINPFVDTLLYPLNFKKYYVTGTYSGATQLQDFALRGSGPLPALPWGTPTLTTGLEHRVAHTPERNSATINPITITGDAFTTFYARDSQTDSGYLETMVPLIKTGWLPLLHTLELQAAGRSERFKVDSGSASKQVFPNRTPVVINYGTPTLNGLPVFSKASYTSNNFTAGLKYQPVKELTLRVSRATAFLPPTPTQLIKDPLAGTFAQTVNDPVTGTRPSVFTIGGGNPDLKPQNSKSLNAGVIWEPTWKPLAGLRLNAEYYKIEQFDAVTQPSLQTVVDNEAILPGRVTRNSSGVITLVDVSFVNLYHLETEGWDLSADYSVKTGAGRFSLHAVESIMLHLKTQFSKTLPEYDAAGFAPTENGGPKYKSNATLTWDWRKWTAGWTTRYFGTYKQFGAAGGPTSLQNTNGAVDRRSRDYVGAQGSDTVDSQMYHDLFVGYAFGKIAQEGRTWRAAGSKLMDGLTIQFGVRNVFDTAPPLDVVYLDTNYALSPFGDTRLRTYWLALKKAF